jgi:hypothetical protein
MLKDGAKRCGCGAGCKTFGACLRAKNIRTDLGLNTSVQNAAMARLDRYEDATRQGVQPRTTGERDITAAMRISEATGTPFQGDLV